jgi:hypothetical protein
MCGSIVKHLLASRQNHLYHSLPYNLLLHLTKIFFETVRVYITHNSRAKYQAPIV